MSVDVPILPEDTDPYTRSVTPGARLRLAIARSVAVVGLAVLALVGVPAIMSVRRPERSRDEGSVVLVVGQDLRRI